MKSVGAYVNKQCQFVLLVKQAAGGAYRSTLKQHFIPENIIFANKPESGFMEIINPGVIINPPLLVRVRVRRPSQPPGRITFHS